MLLLQERHFLPLLLLQQNFLLLQRGHLLILLLPQVEHIPLLLIQRRKSWGSHSPVLSV